MNSLIAGVLEFQIANLWVGFAIFLRVGAAMAILPAFGEQVIPPRVRLLLGISFTVVVAPVVSPLLPEAALSLTSIRLFYEVVIGLALGISIRLFVLALQTAGSIAAQSISLSQIFGASGEPAPAVSHMFLMAGLALMAMMGLHVRVAEFLIYSYEIMPFASPPDAVVLTNWGIYRVSKAFSLAFTLAAPFLIASTIYNFALGVINRAMPQLMVTFVGAPAITAGGLILLTIASPLLLSVWAGALSGFLTFPFEVR